MSPMTKVLIVEDDVAFALMLRTWLSKNGYEAESVVSAEQAVKRMGECVFDVVLSDLRLPDRRWRLSNWELSIISRNRSTPKYCAKK